jgi:hypothetical protein
MLVRLGVSTEAARGKAQAQGRKLSQAVHDQTDADGLLYLSRLTGRTCVCVYERALPGPVPGSIRVGLFRRKILCVLHHLQHIDRARRHGTIGSFGAVREEHGGARDCDDGDQGEGGYGGLHGGSPGSLELATT